MQQVCATSVGSALDVADYKWPAECECPCAFALFWCVVFGVGCVVGGVCVELRPILFSFSTFCVRRHALEWSGVECIGVEWSGVEWSALELSGGERASASIGVE
jgi:hypothetical protein